MVVEEVKDLVERREEIWRWEMSEQGGKILTPRYSAISCLIFRTPDSNSLTTGAYYHFHLGLLPSRIFGTGQGEDRSRGGEPECLHFIWTRGLYRNSGSRLLLPYLIKVSPSHWLGLPALPNRLPVSGISVAYQRRQVASWALVELLDFSIDIDSLEITSQRIRDSPVIRYRLPHDFFFKSAKRSDKSSRTRSFWVTSITKHTP